MKFNLLSSIVLFSASLVRGQNLLPQGTYRITNWLADPAGNQLALTFNGNNTRVTMQESRYDPNQLWVFRPFAGPPWGNQISPFLSPDLEVGFGPNSTLVTIPAQLLVWQPWLSNKIDGFFKFSDGNSTVVWGLDDVTDGASVRLSPAASGDFRQLWVPVEVTWY